MDSKRVLVQAQRRRARAKAKRHGNDGSSDFDIQKRKGALMYMNAEDWDLFWMPRIAPVSDLGCNWLAGGTGPLENRDERGVTKMI